MTGMDAKDPLVLNDQEKCQKHLKARLNQVKLNLQNILLLLREGCGK